MSPMKTDKRITDLEKTDTSTIEQLARLLYESFKDRTDSWPTIEDARQEVLKSLEPGRISRVLLDGDGRAIGWIGAISLYDGRVWEIHPIVVAQSERRQGHGRCLVQDLQALAEKRGALTLWAGSDDERYETSLGGADLYENPARAIADIRNLKGHPFEFFVKVGFSVVGFVPDANGRGKPDILLAKKIGA